MFLAIFVLWKKYSRMLIVGSGNCFPILVMLIRLFLAGPTKLTGMVRTIICPGKTFFPFNCERKLVICYSAIYYSWTSGYRVKTIFLGYFWHVWTPYSLRIRIRTVLLGFNRFWHGHLWSFRLRFRCRVFRASRIRACSFTKVCSCICISNFGLSVRTQWFKKSCHKSWFSFCFFLWNQFSNNSFRCIGTWSFVMASPIVVDLPCWLDMTKLKEPKDFFYLNVWSFFILRTRTIFV